MVRVRNSNLGWRFFAFKCCFSRLSVDRFGKIFEGVMTLGQVKKFTKFLLIWSTESWETQHLKAKEHKPKFEFRTLYTSQTDLFIISIATITTTTHAPPFALPQGCVLHGERAHQILILLIVLIGLPIFLIAFGTASWLACLGADSDQTVGHYVQTTIWL